MTPGKFLRLVWPSQGHYCIAHPFKIPGTELVVYSHHVYPTISEAVSYCLEQKHQKDIYFAVLTLRDPKVWNPDKDNRKTGEKGAFEYRTQQNMLAARSVFFDLDVGEGKHKYPSQRDALHALLKFLQASRLPMPTLVSSGGGVHVYWHFDADMPVAEWRTLAANMRQLAEALGLDVDPMRTTDVTSVLRVPDTFNWKDRENPRAVRVIQEGVVTPLDGLQQLISDALIRAGRTVLAGATPTRAPAAAGANPFGDSNLNIDSFGPPPTLSEVGAACAQVREMVRMQVDPSHGHYGKPDNPFWYGAILPTLKHVEGGDDWCRKLTALHPRDNADIEDKLRRLEAYPPARCQKLRDSAPWGDEPCKTCQFLNDPSVPNPIAAARKHTPAAPPVLGLAGGAAGPAAPTPPTDVSGPPPIPPAMLIPSAALLQVTLPNPPKPWERLKAGGIAITKTDKDGNSTTTVIYPNDLYPVKRHRNDVDGTEQQTWCVHLPRSGAKEFTIDADVLYDTRKFCAAMAHNGVYPNKADISTLQDYMVAYITQLQKDIDADTQSTHLGWTDEYRQFVLPDKTLLETGQVIASSLTNATARAAQFLTKRGDLQSQIALMSFYSHPAYIPNQTAILDSLASILLHATGHHGIVVNCSGESGASKSTTLYTAAGLWGDPTLWPLNGTNSGATAKARAQRINSNSNLPTCVDEITDLLPRDVGDLVMNITQPGHRLRLQVDGTERKSGDNYKSAIMIATANSSLHSLLSTNNAAGTAGSMRVFEMKFYAQHVHTKAEADEFLRQIRLHHGHIGEVFAHFVVRNRVAVDRRVQQVMAEIDQEASITGAERFWSGRIAVGLVACEIARALGLVPFDAAAIRAWSVRQQVPAMRGIVKEEYRDPLGVLTDYIAEKNGNIVVVERVSAAMANTDTAYTLSNMHGSLLGHYDKATGILYLLKQGFKDHCTRIGASSSRIIDELSAADRKVIVNRQQRVVLGKGTNIAKGQAWCFAVDMRHPAVADALVPPAAANDQNKVA